MKHLQTEALFFLQIYSAMGKPCQTPQEKYNQLREFFESISRTPQQNIDFTINHALKQSDLLCEYSGFTKDFWLNVKLENINYNYNGINK